MKNKGFTLIELLVVVAIIGVLAGIVIAALGDARARARDARRLSDIKTIQTALEVYNLDNGTYPTMSVGSHISNWSNLENQLDMTLPVDPLNTSAGTTWSDARTDGNYVYSYQASTSPTLCEGRIYVLNFQLEGRLGNGANDGVQLCNGNTPTHNNAFTVGVGSDGTFVTPDLTGDPR